MPILDLETIKLKPMKKISLFVALIIATFQLSIAQDFPINQSTGKITYLEVVDASGLATKDLYEVVKKWGATQKYTITEDKANESIVFKASTPLDYPSVTGSGIDKGRVEFSCSIFIKDGKYRYIFTDLEHKAEGKLVGVDGGKLENVSPDCGKGRMSAKGWVTIKMKADANLKALVTDLRRVVKEAQNDPAKKTDW